MRYNEGGRVGSLAPALRLIYGAGNYISHSHIPEAAAPQCKIHDGKRSAPA